MSVPGSNSSTGEPSGPAALYRRYRPTRLSKLIGQDDVRNALTSALAAGRVEHAYLFFGPRGTGKTSAARVFARALNCEAPVGVEPCNTCFSCSAILAGNSFDVQEIDAASNSGVDAIREMIASASLSPTSRKRVFIIDEVHMLSTAAYNALLKTLEDTLEHVVFVLATTNLEKVSETVRSRCQKLPFRLVPAATMREHLTRVAAHAGLDASPEVIESAVTAGRGSVRDALSALGAILATGNAGLEADPSVALLRAMVKGEILPVFAAVAEITNEGVSARVLAESTLGSLRELFLIQMGAPELVSGLLSTEMEELAAALGPKRTVAAIDAVGGAVLAMRADHDARVNLEIQLARWARLNPAPPVQDESES